MQVMLSTAYPLHARLLHAGCLSWCCMRMPRTSAVGASRSGWRRPTWQVTLQGSYHCWQPAALEHLDPGNS
jgi:hypothetical protein